VYNFFDFYILSAVYTILYLWVCGRGENMTTHDVKQKWIQHFREIYDYLVKSDNEAKGNMGGTPPTLTEFYTADAARNALSVFYAIVPERGHGMGEHDNYAVSTESSEQAANYVPPGAYRYLADNRSGDSGSENADVDDHSETQFASITDVLVDVVNSNEYDNNLAKTLEILETKAQGPFESNIFFKIFSDRGLLPSAVDLAFFNMWEQNTPGGLRISSHFLHERVERSLKNSDRPAGLVNQLWKFATKMTEKDPTLNEVLGDHTDFRDFVYGDLEKRRYEGDKAAPLKLQDLGAGFNGVDVNDDNTEHTDDEHTLLNINSLGVNKPLNDFTNTAVDLGIQKATLPNQADGFFDFENGSANTSAEYGTPPDIKSSLESTSPEHENINENAGMPVFTHSGSNVVDSGSADDADSGRSFGDPETTGDIVGPLEDANAVHRGFNKKGRTSPAFYVSNKDDEREDIEEPEVAKINNFINTEKNTVPGSKEGTPIFMSGKQSPKNWVNEPGGAPNTLERLLTVISPVVSSENVSGLRTPMGTRRSTPIGTQRTTSAFRGGSRRLRGGPGTAVHTLRHQKWNKENAKGKK
jgi:hypothetical protein